MRATGRGSARGSKNRNSRLPTAFVVLVAAGLGLMLIAFALKGTAANSALTGRPASDFSLGLFDGGSFTLSHQQGQVVVVNAWASWCPPCRAEAPTLEKVWREYRDRGVVFVGVAVDDDDSDSLAFMRQVGMDYPIGPDRTNAISDGYAPNGLPQTTVIDRRGVIAAVKMGGISEAELRSYIEEALRK